MSCSISLRTSNNFIWSPISSNPQASIWSLVPLFARKRSTFPVIVLLCWKKKRTENLPDFFGFAWSDLTENDNGYNFRGNEITCTFNITLFSLHQKEEKNIEEHYTQDLQRDYLVKLKFQFPFSLTNLNTGQYSLTTANYMEYTSLAMF